MLQWLQSTMKEKADAELINGANDENEKKKIRLLN